MRESHFSIVQYALLLEVHELRFYLEDELIFLIGFSQYAYYVHHSDFKVSFNLQQDLIIIATVILIY